MTFGKSLDVRFVNDRVIPGHASYARLPVPVKVWVDDYAFGHKRSAVALVEGQVLFGGSDRVTKALGRPAQIPRMSASIRVKYELVRIKSVPRARFIWPVHTKAVDAAGIHILQVTVPDLIGILRQRDAL